MWNDSSATMPSVLIVENENGEVFIVEDKSSESLVDRILNNSRLRKKPVISFDTREPSPTPLK